MGKIDRDLIDPVVEPEQEKLHRTVRASVSGVPIFGGALLETFNTLIEPPMLKRRTAWMIQVTEALNGFIDSGVVTEKSLQESDKFFTTLVRASSAAIRSHEQEKLEALKNSILNSALPDSPNDTIQQLFLNIVDNSTSWHLALLKLFQSPEDWQIKNNHTFRPQELFSIKSIIESAYPELKNEQFLYKLVWSELYRNGLVDTENTDGSRTINRMFTKRTTALGDKFLEFISKPIL